MIYVVFMSDFMASDSSRKRNAEVAQQSVQDGQPGRAVAVKAGQSKACGSINVTSIQRDMNKTKAGRWDAWYAG